MDYEFEPFPKIDRLSRECVITEKLDGTNAQIFISDDLSVIKAGSRTRWIYPTKTEDNYGFARWVEDNKEELLKLGPGRHFGEWWGSGIQRGYGLTEKRFSLFNVHRWGEPDDRPRCVGVVPTLYTGEFDTNIVEWVLNVLRDTGSIAAPDFSNPEGIIIYHTAAKTYFKKTLDKDDQPKGANA